MYCATANMTFRLSIQEALSRGLIDASTATAMRTPKTGHGRTHGARKSRARAGVDPQTMLYRSLLAELGPGDVAWEKKGLIPGRKYRVDIYLPASRLVIEFDGFQYHRSKAAFQKDRERQNLLISHGFHPLRFFAKQVFEDLDAVTAQIVSVHKAMISASLRNANLAAS